MPGPSKPEIILAYVSQQRNQAFDALANAVGELDFLSRRWNDAEALKARLAELQAADKPARPLKSVKDTRDSAGS